MHPYLLKIGSLEIRFYSLFIISAFLISMIFISKKSVRLGFDPKKIENLVLITFIMGALGARLYYVIFNFDYFKVHPSEILAVWKGGLAIHGGIIFGLITILVYCKKNNINIFSCVDMLAPFLIFSQGVGRMGNFTNGEAHGFPTIVPFDIIFRVKPIFNNFWSKALLENNVTNTPYALTDFYNKIIFNPARVHFDGKEYLLKEYVPWGVKFPGTYNPPAFIEFGSMPVHPTFFYEMILNFIAAIILLCIWRKDSNIGKGIITGLYFIFYGVIRGFVTFFRADDLMLGNFRAPHVISLTLIIFGCAWIYVASRFYKSKR